MAEQTLDPAAGGNRLFPIFLKLENFDLLIVGGGPSGLEMISAVLRNSPATRATLVDEAILDEIRAFSAPFPQVVLIEKAFSPSDLEGHKIVIAATDDGLLNEKIKSLAAERGLFCKVAGRPERSDFQLGSVVQKGDLKIAISTNGHSPAIEKRLKEALNEAFPDELDAILQKMPELRSRLASEFSGKLHLLSDLIDALVTNPAASVSALLTEPNIQKIDGKKWRGIATAAFLSFGALVVSNVYFYWLPDRTLHGLAENLGPTFWLFVATGFGAQLVDGLLGMGYGVVSQIVLMGMGVPLASISSSIHTAEMFSSGASGYAHYRFGNVNRRLFRALLVPGILGAIAGAALLSKFGESSAKWIKPALAVYALLLGIRILTRVFLQKTTEAGLKNLGWLAGAGGFLDSFAGGGWGPLVTSTLLEKGGTPKNVIGTVSLVEFFVTLASAITFFSMIGVSHWQVIAGLVVGGVAAAPIAARLAGRLPVRTMTIAVGAMVILWSLRILWKIFFAG